MNQKPALFLDRDGVINRRTVGNYIRQPSEFEFETGALEALQVLAGCFGRIVVVTNQAGVGKGLMTGADLAAVHQYMLAGIRRSGGRIDRVYQCPHRPDVGCGCRKPATGMGLQAQSDFPDIRFENSWIAGDSLSDIQFGQALNMKTALIAGKEEEIYALSHIRVDSRFESLLDFARFVQTNASVNNGS